MGKTETEGMPVTTAPCVPDQVDYRSTPNIGQTAAQEHDPSVYGNPNTHGTPVAPQPNIGERGYTLNSLEAPPNQMVPEGPAGTMLPGYSEDDPSSMMAWEMWDAGGDS